MRTITVEVEKLPDAIDCHVKMILNMIENRHVVHAEIEIALDKRTQSIIWSWRELILSLENTIENHT